MSTEKIERTPQSIIGDDAYMQLVFEGYEVVKADELSRLREVERRAKDVIRPFAEYMEDGMDLDNNGLPLPDEQGVGWIYLNHGRFRSARDLYRALSERDGQDG